MANKKITDLMSGTPTRDSLIESATDVGGTMVSRKFKVGAVADVNNVQIASEYDDTATYAYGAYCIKDGVLYRCTTAISVAEAWDSTHWTAVMVTGEYKRVRIMTKAQFDLLSNDEKDGFIYVSDYPTKIQDIDNVTLTTSDNNKLLGVSVSGGDISVGAFFSITPTEVSITKHNFSTNDTQVVRVGNLLICSISVSNTSTYNSWTDICSITGSFDSNITIMASLSTWDKSRYAQAYMYNTNEIRIRIMGADANSSYRGQMIIPIDFKR